MEAREYAVSGRVQGVGFRAATEHEARRLGLAGWVSNRSDGTVAVHAEGDADALGALEGWLHDGPVGARVTAVESEPAPSIRATGFRARA